MSNPRLSPEVKEEAVRQVVERGYSVAEVSERLGVSTQSLYKWVKAIKPDKSDEHAVDVSLKPRATQHGIGRLYTETEGGHGCLTTSTYGPGYKWGDYPATEKCQANGKNFDCRLAGAAVERLGR